METTLQFDPQSKQLSFRLDQKVTAHPELELKGRAFLNTISGDFTYSGTLKKYVTTGTVFKGQGTQPLRLGAGIALSSSSTEPTIVATAQKSIGLFDGRNSTVISALGELDVTPSTKKVGKSAKLRVHQKLLNFTAKQDVLLSAGVDLDWGAKNKVATVPYFSVRENSWGLERRGDRWNVTYDL